jgi:hypothetical protein
MTAYICQNVLKYALTWVHFTWSIQFMCQIRHKEILLAERTYTPTLIEQTSILLGLYLQGQIHSSVLMVARRRTRLRSLLYPGLSISVPTVPSKTHRALESTHRMEAGYKTVPEQAIMNSRKEVSDYTGWDHQQTSTFTQVVRSISFLNHRAASLCV